jgi:hypothetical protein
MSLNMISNQKLVRPARKVKAPHPLSRPDPPPMLPRPFVPFQLPFKVSTVGAAQVSKAINETVLGISDPTLHIPLEIRLSAIGAWELTGGSTKLKVYDPIVVSTDLSGTATLVPDINPLLTREDYAARNKWSHAYYRYKPEVHRRSLRLDVGVGAANPAFYKQSSNAATPELHSQLFGSWRAVVQ